MRLLLDTNVFLWGIAGETSKLSARALAVLRDERNELVLSAASLWEIALKVRAGKLALPENGQFFREHMTALGVRSVLPIEARHIFELFQIPDIHRDPFDRLLVAQCKSESLPLIASDRILRRYPIEVIW